VRFLRERLRVALSLGLEALHIELVGFYHLCSKFRGSVLFGRIIKRGKGRAF
jgi:hypothetical protein